MRQGFDAQMRLDCSSVQNVQLNLDCRDEIVPILAALKHIYSRPEVRNDILDAIAEDVNGTSNANRGRKGMDYWQILVLAAVRLGCNLDYDKLQDLAEQHRVLRQIMGIGDWDQQTTFDWRRIRDNITQVRPGTIERINHLIVAEGHRLVPEATQTVRADSFVAETEIHYPTESSLIRDGLRKVLELSVALAAVLGMSGWRQHKHLYKKAKVLARRIDRIASRKGSGYQERLKGPYRELLGLVKTITARVEKLRENVRNSALSNVEVLALDGQLEGFLKRTLQVSHTARRRIIQGEKVPNSEKLFSIFEPHTQLYKRGKAGQPVQFGRQVLIYEDGAGFIAQAYLMPRDADDRDVVIEQTRNLQERFNGGIQRASFDRGFHSPENQRQLALLIPHPCLPKPGVRQAAAQQAQATVEFRRARQRHSGIESAIHGLQSGNGMARCRDRTEQGFSRYLQLGVLGRNLHVLGKILIARQDASSNASRSKRQHPAA